MDSMDGNNQLDKDEFKYGLQDWGVKISNSERDILMKWMDKNSDGVISFDEFLIALKGGLSETRMGVVKQAFDKFDNVKSGVITIDDLRGVYTAEPQDGKTSDEIFEDFLNGFGDRNDDGKITW